MATAKLKRKPRLSKFESYKAANIKDLGLFGDLAWIIWGYLGIWRGLSGVIFPLPGIFSVFGNHDDNNRSTDYYYLIRQLSAIRIGVARLLRHHQRSSQR